jgi:hypothetical protein
MKKMHLIRWIASLFAVVLLSGCALFGGGEGRDINDPANSLVFAYIDMADAPTSLDWASLQQVGSKEDEGYWGMGADDGLIYNQYLPNGNYKLAQFGGSAFFKGEYRYSFPAYGRNETAVKIARPGIHFLGAYRYVKVKTGLFEADRFDMEAIKQPSERELLLRLQQQKWVKGTQWEARIASRLAALKK